MKLKAVLLVLLGASCTMLLGATVYNQFSPGGALSGTWNSQNVNVAAGSPFITGALPVANETPAGSDTQVQLNSAGVLSASANLTFNPATSTLGIAGSHGTAGNVLTSGGTGAAAWGTVNLASANAVTNTLPVTSGGTGLATLTTHGVLLGEGTANLAAVAAMAADTLLQGQSGSDPAAVSVNNCGSSTQALSYSTSTHTFGCQTISSLATPVTVANGGTGLGTLPVHGILLGEATSNVSNVAAMAADTLLQGQGASADPAAVSVNNCGSSSTALSYSTSTHAFGCQTITGGSATPAGVSGNVQWNNAGSFGGVTNGTSGQALVSNGASVPSWGAPNVLTGTASSTNGCYPVLGANATTPTYDSVFTACVNPGLHSFSATTFNGALNGNASSATLASTLTVTSSTTNANFPPILGNGTSMIYDASVLINPSTHTVTATTFSGALSGNATTATSATNLTGGAVTTNSSGALLAGGTKFTASGCSNSATVGGAIAGQFTSGTSGTCTVTITLPTAANGWACRANDITTPAVMNQTAKTTTSCTISGTTTTSDVVVFLAMGY